jgi:predicted CopG family antitoxin
MDKKTIEVSEDLYTAIQKLKEVFQEMTGQPIEKDEDVLSILIGGFIDSLAQSE